ncbi:Putative sulfate transporter ychM [Yokenella regensburgei]|nr:Putative sulfate transporter ychM [Yokenella regensburgei]
MPESQISAPHQATIKHILRSPALLTRETLAGVITALALIPEVISFSVIAGVDPKVSLIASVVLCLAMSVLGGRPAMVTAAAGSVALVIGPMVHQYGVGYILPAVILAGFIQILFGVFWYGKADAPCSVIGDDRLCQRAGSADFLCPGAAFLEP